jgi:hypothetical protein
MATGRVPTTANSPLTAKGDLFGYSTTQARVPVGSDGDTLVADSAASTGLRWQGNYAAGKNAIINAAFDIWQRGSTFSNPANNDYTADRFLVGYNGTGATRTISRQAFTAGTAPVAGYEGTYFYRYDISAAGTGNSNNTIIQRIENVRTFAGQTVTISFWAKGDSARNLKAQIYQQFGSGGSSQVYCGQADVTLSTSWVRYSATISIPSIAGKTIGTGDYLEWRFLLPTNTTLTIDVWGLQIEAGSVATAFQTATGTLQGELAACQRYYYRQGGNSIYQTMGIGWAISTTVAQIRTFFPVQMRTTPTSIDSSTLIFFDQVNAGVATGTLQLVTNQSSPTVGYLTTAGTTGLTQYRSYELAANNSTSAYLGFSAEL